MTHERGLSVEFKPESLKHYRLADLRESVRAALAGALDGYGKAGDQVVRRELGDSAMADMQNTAAGRQLRPFFDALERVDVSAVGPRDIAKVGLIDGKIRVAFADEALMLHESTLAREIDAAVNDMFEKRSVRAVELYAEMIEHEEESHDGTDQ